MCGTPVPRCKDCGIVLNDTTAYHKKKSATGFQSRCKNCQVEYQKGLRERKKEGRGVTLVETKLSGRGDNRLRLKYNPRRQIVEIFGPVNDEAKKAGAYWVDVFDKKEYIYHEGKKSFRIRIVHISRASWEEATVDLESLEKVEAEEKELQDYL